MSGSECVSPCVRLRCWQPVSGHASSSTLGNKNLSESGVGMEERKQEAFPHCGHIFRPATFFLFLFDHSWQQFIINLFTLMVFQCFVTWSSKVIFYCIEIWVLTLYWCTGEFGRRSRRWTSGHFQWSPQGRPQGKNHSPVPLKYINIDIRHCAWNMEVKKINGSNFFTF